MPWETCRKAEKEKSVNTAAAVLKRTSRPKTEQEGEEARGKAG